MKSDLIDVLADFVNLRDSKHNVTLDTATHAHDHEVEGIFYYQTQDPIFEKAYLVAQYYYINRKRCLEKIKQIFDNNGISYFIVKGDMIAHYYPMPSLRTMGDSDIVVKERERAKTLLIEQGFRFEDKGDYEYYFSKGDINFELHDRLLYGDRLNSEHHIQFFNSCWDYVIDNQLDWNFHFVFIIEHLRRHLLWESVGFRQFMDVAILVKNAYFLFDWDIVKAMLAGLDLLKFAEVCFALNKNWFDVAPPFEVPDIDEEFFKFASEEIYENGVFGFSKSVKTRFCDVLLTESASGGYRFAFLQRYVNRFFPPYTEMITWPQYRFLRGRRYLLPLCWVYRFFRNAFRINKWEKMHKQTFVSKDKFSERNDELKKWGL